MTGTRTVELPGLVDLQVNGFAGVDFGDPATTAAGIVRAVEAIQKTGVTRFLPTLVSSSLDAFATCARTLVKTAHPAIAGIHMEGPYISPEDGPRGAHGVSTFGAPTSPTSDAGRTRPRGRIRLVTLAPEAPGALTLVEHLAESGVRVAIGHTAASGPPIRDAVAAGATLSTHLGNGCAQTLPRHPNLIWEQLAEDRLLASFIVDGHHLPPATVHAMLRAKTPARTILVTDAIAAAGMPPGIYTLGGQKLELDATGRVAAPGAPNLAGSALLLPVAIGNTVRFTGAAARGGDPDGLDPPGRVHRHSSSRDGRGGVGREGRRAERAAGPALAEAVAAQREPAVDRDHLAGDVGVGLQQEAHGPRHVLGPAEARDRAAVHVGVVLAGVDRRARHAGDRGARGDDVHPDVGRAAVLLGEDAGGVRPARPWARRTPGCPRTDRRPACSRRGRWRRAVSRRSISSAQARASSTGASKLAVKEAWSAGAVELSGLHARGVTGERHDAVELAFHRERRLEVALAHLGLGHVAFDEGGRGRRRGPAPSAGRRGRCRGSSGSRPPAMAPSCSSSAAIAAPETARATRQQHDAAGQATCG